MGIESPLHLLFIAVVALLVLGPKRLPELARALGKGVREFRGAMEAGEHDHAEAEREELERRGADRLHEPEREEHPT
ncbi:MAG TPA: twin-arginine translocase TatA/TatE family subunit [Solirubrobacteraceae bacterium]|jgi:TatA/E family protein of Tat protein translocase|nr:twin-arginine translocase TatA/TatE family subunit [Solirubrobacteraceae bacterium]